MSTFLSIEVQTIIKSASRAERGSLKNQQELRRLVENRSPEHLRELVALMWLGRGFENETVADWPRLMDGAQGLDAEYLCSKADLADYLDAGQMKIVNAVLDEARRNRAGDQHAA